MVALEARAWGGVWCVYAFFSTKNTLKTTTTFYTGAKSGGSSGLAFALVPPSEPRANLAVRGTLAERRSIGEIDGQSKKRRMAVVITDPTIMREISSVDSIFTEMSLPPSPSVNLCLQGKWTVCRVARKGGRRGFLKGTEKPKHFLTLSNFF